MRCKFPLYGYRGPQGALVFNRAKALNPRSEPVPIPCGQCRDCRVSRAREWATRIVCEVNTTSYPVHDCLHGCSPSTWCSHRESIFATFTLNDDHLGDGSLSKRTLQLLFKRLAFKQGPFRRFAVGEYGGKFGRPHYHAIIFGQGFLEDRYRWRKDGAIQYFRSPSLEAAWTDPETGASLGHVEFSGVSLGAAEYCAKYALKRRRAHAEPGSRRQDEGPMGLGVYVRPHPKTGEPVEVLPEFALMSRRPGIGATWAKLYGHEAVADEELRITGRGGEAKKRPIPRFFRDRFALDFPEWAESLKADRTDRAKAAFLASIHSGENDVLGASSVFNAWDREDREKTIRSLTAGRRVID